MKVLYCCYRALTYEGGAYSSGGSFSYLMPELAECTDGLYLLAPVVNGHIKGDTTFAYSDRLHVVPVRTFYPKWLHLLSGEFWSLRALRRFVRTQRDVDVVVVAIPSSTYYSAFLPFLRRPMVAVVAGDEQGLMRRSPHPAMLIARAFELSRLKGFAERRLLRRGSAIVCRSEQLARECRQALGPASRKPIRVVTSGVETDLFQPCTDAEKAEARRDLGIAPDVPVLGFVATAVTGAKGAEILREAFGKLRISLPDATLLVVGNHSDALADQPGVLSCGYVPPDRLPLYYGAMDVFACPSLSEGAPKVVMEACACGLPVVTSRVGAIPEWFLGGHDGHCGPRGLDELSGLVVDVGDSEALAEACLRLLSDPDLRARMGASARALALSRFNYRMCAAQLADVLCRAAKEAHG